MATHTPLALPKRPKSHEREEKSRQRFAALVPTDRALLRPRPAPEYGVDIDVELVDDERMTGAEFSVQLKSKANVTGRPQVSIALSTLNYWRKMSRPILLVLWDDASDRFWGRWAHNIDTHTARDGQKSVSITFAENDRLLTSRWLSIENEVYARHAWAYAQQNSPLALTARATGTLAGQSAGLVKSYVLSAIARYPEMLSIRATGAPAIRVGLGPDRIEVATAGGPSSILDYPRLRKAPLDPNRVVADTMLVIALQFTRLNLHAFAARMVSDFWRESPMAYQGMLADCARALLADGRIDEAILLARSVDDSPGAEAPVNLACLSVEPGSAAWRGRFADEIAAWADRQGKSAGGQAVAAFLVHAGSLVVQESPDRAFAILTRASELDETLVGDQQWNYWIAAAAFLAREYTDAARHYELALNLGLASAAPLLGDAMLWSGDYIASLAHLESPADNIDTAEFELKLRCFGFLARTLAIEHQDRNTEAAFAEWFEESNPPLERCWSALAQDMLFTPALDWLADVLLGVEYCLDDIPDRDIWRAHEYDIALCATFSLPAEPSLWERVLLLCPTGEKEIYRNVVITARRMCGDEILRDLWDSDRRIEAELIERLFAETV